MENTNPQDLLNRMHQIQTEIQTGEALVEVADLQGDCHTHSDWSDGHETIETMAAAARAISASAAAHVAQCRHEIVRQHRGYEETVAGLGHDVLEQGSVRGMVVAIKFVHPKPRPVGRQITFGATDAGETEGPIARVLVGARKDCAKGIDLVASELPG